MDYEEFKKNYSNNGFYERVYNISNDCFYERKQNFFETDDLPGVLKGSIIVLTSHKTASSAENFINIMKSYTDTVLIGSSTFGSTGQPLLVRLESGGSFRICTNKSKTLTNKEFINIGFKPDIECSLTIEDIINGNDTVMKKAICEMRNVKGF